MAGYDPKQPRDKEGQWTDSGEELAAENKVADAAREAAGLAEVDFHQQRMQLIEKARTEAGLSKGQMQGWERVRVSKEYGGGSGFIYELSEDANFARIHKKPDGQGEFLGYYHLSSLMPFK